MDRRAWLQHSLHRVANNQTEQLTLPCFSTGWLTVGLQGICSRVRGSQGMRLGLDSHLSEASRAEPVCRKQVKISVSVAGQVEPSHLEAFMLCSEPHMSPQEAQQGSEWRRSSFIIFFLRGVHSDVH